MCQVGLYFLKLVFVCCALLDSMNAELHKNVSVELVSVLHVLYNVRCTDLKFRYSMYFILILAYDTCCVVLYKLCDFSFFSLYYIMHHVYC